MKKQSKSKSLLTLDFNVNGEEVLFTLDGEPRFKMKADSLLRLIDSHYIARERDNRGKDEELKAIDSLPMFARIQRFLKRGFTADEAAEVLGIKPDLIRRFLGVGIQKYTRNPQMLSDEIERQAKAEGDYCLKKQRPQTMLERSTGQAPSPEYALVNVAVVKDMIKDFMSYGEISNYFGLDPDAFKEWAEINRELIS